jgi:hypothetical protein
MLPSAESFCLTEVPRYFVGMRVYGVLTHPLGPTRRISGFTSALSATIMQHQFLQLMFSSTWKRPAVVLSSGMLIDFIGIPPVAFRRILAEKEDSPLGFSSSQYEQDFVDENKSVPVTPFAYPPRIRI